MSSVNSPSPGELSSKYLPDETSPGNFLPVGSPSSSPSQAESLSSSPSQLYSPTSSLPLSSTHLPQPCTLPLEFHRYILKEVLSEDGLLILSRGLGLRRIICALLRIYS